MESLPVLALLAPLAWAAASPPAWASLARVDYDAPPVPNASSLVGLTVCGYQQWFRAPNDTATNEGWTHWGNGVGALHNGTGIEEDYWPDLSEFGDDEKFAAPGYKFADGSQAYLFSSINARTTLRHFQWMEAYGIDGVALQSFGPLGLDHEILNHTLAAAAATNRVAYVEYDLSGYAGRGAAAAAMLKEDWAGLRRQGVPDHARYVHEGGLPVVGIFGFYMDRFSGEEANAILDVFDGTAFVAGAGQWWWRSDQPSANWTRAYDRMGSWSPWNSGNWNGDAAHPAAATGYWAADKAAAEQAGVLWQPELAPGMSTNHRDGTPAGSGRLPRLRGAYLWAQFYAAATIKAKTAFVGMFDELDEGTQILKVVNDPPAPGDIGYEGLPSDCYLVLTGLGSKMLRGDAPRNATTPDCAALTQPTAPAARAPAAGVLQWSPALALAGGGAVDHYEVLVDGAVRRTADAATLAGASAATSFRVRAVNSLGNAGAWSP